MANRFGVAKQWLMTVLRVLYIPCEMQYGRRKLGISILRLGTVGMARSMATDANEYGIRHREYSPRPPLRRGVIGSR